MSHHFSLIVIDPRVYCVVGCLLCIIVALLLITQHICHVIKFCTFRLFTPYNYDQEAINLFVTVIQFSDNQKPVTVVERFLCSGLQSCTIFVVNLFEKS